MITEDTTAYLDGQGTFAQQQLFQDASERIREIYRAQYPDDPEDEADMTADQIAGAAMVALGDAALEDLGREVRTAEQAYFAALDRLGGAMIVSDIQGVPTATIAKRAGVARGTATKRLGR